MTAVPIGAVGEIGSQGANAAQSLANVTQQTGVQQAQAPLAPVEVPAATLQLNPGASSLPTKSFGESVLDSVYTEIDQMQTRMPDIAGEQSAVDKAMREIASDTKETNPMATEGVNALENDAITRLSNAFDHAVFMALVNQTISGVGDTSRTLIRQS